VSSLVADITIAGAGPAGLALAIEVQRRGARVVVVDPAPHARWPNRYGAWWSDLEKSGLTPFVDVAWSRPLVNTGEGPRALKGTYARLDKVQLQDRWRARLPEPLTARVVSATPTLSGFSVHLSDGRTVSTRALVDATGTGVLLRHPRPPRAFQAAYGVLARVSDHPWGPGEASFMDFSGGRAGPPTFLYALPLSSDLVFLEETSLAAAPAVPLATLKARLYERLRSMQVDILEVIDEEHCHIPMDVPAPLPGRIVGFGAAAGYVHPATGYQVTRAVRQAPAVAEALVSGLSADPDQAARSAWAAVWPAGHVATRALHDLGLGLLLGLDAEETRTFFRTFFSLSPSTWRAYLDATSAPAAIAAAMARVFVQLPAPLRARVLGHALGPGRVHLARAVSIQVGGAS
jgi:lycopene beta-cyclase